MGSQGTIEEAVLNVEGRHASEIFLFYAEKLRDHSIFVRMFTHGEVISIGNCGSF